MVLCMAGLQAQGKADFSGTWTLVPDPDAAPPAGGGGRGGRGGRGGGGGGICGQACTIAQDGTALTVTRTTQGGEQRMVYRLDGSETKSMQQGRGGEIEIVSKAMWEGNSVSITTTRPGRQGGPAVTQKSVLSVNAGALTIENTTEGQPAPTKQMYKKG
jgi:hypothetical protein